MGNCQTQCYQKSTSQVNSVDCSKLIIHVKTWQKDAFSLFDYENAANVQEQTFMVKQYFLQFQVSSEGFLAGRNQVEWIENESLIKDQLCKIKKKDENYYLVNSHFLNEEKKKSYQENDECHTIGNKFLQCQTRTLSGKVGNKIWRVIHENGIALQEGDVIKLGRVKFTIRSIVLEVQHVQSVLNFESQQSSQSDQNMCRICCSCASSPSNPLLNPCKCSGSIKYIHLECLKTWLRMKLENRQSEHCIVYMWKNLECELCKFNYPPKFKSDDAYYDLVELSKPNDYPYLLMEFTNKQVIITTKQGQQVEYNNSSGVYIVKFSMIKDLKLGRSNDTDVRVNDISVSRNHARFLVSDSQVFLMDNHSKFGTLQLIRNEKLQIYRGMEVQVGRSLISFQ